MKKLALILSLFMGVNASAGLLLEPYAGYAIGNSEYADGSDKADVTGLSYGGRIGWTLPFVFFALDYSIGNTDFKYDDGSKIKSEHTTMAAVAGVNLKIVRLWAGYIFDTEAEDKDGTLKFEGNGMKAGIGFKPLPVIPLSFNLEYGLHEYDKANGLTLGSNLETKVLLLSVSAPFNL